MVEVDIRKSIVFHRTRDHAVSLTSLCLISHHPFVSIFHDLLVLLKQIIDSCSYRAAQKTNIKDIVWSVLTGHWLDAIPPEAMREIKEIETWILMLLSSPVPVPGKTKVQLEVMPSDISPIFEFALPDHTRFSLVDFPLHLPFELLGVDTAVRVLAAIMLEFKASFSYI
ncbi:DENN domain protein [Ancylostoma caninum]|uniref:DENN domain protein n=1 Tax=Ancylostoma caninum TaxID=29170 RepID=A0A368F864_ANCCA|nr:DENN domain protein [Ancylostoma caninum]